VLAMSDQGSVDIAFKLIEIASFLAAVAAFQPSSN
jgi:hypothetical protein